MKAFVANDLGVVRRNFKGNETAVPGFTTILNNIPTLTRLDVSQVISATRKKESKKSFKKKESRSIKALAEAIILQSIEDLWSSTHKKGSIEFFRGQGFNQCADAAGMNVLDRLRLIRMLRNLDGRAFLSRHAKRIHQLSLK
jgi:hypothetical protein